MKKYLNIIVLVLSVVFAKAQTRDTTIKKEPKVFINVEVAADFPGGIEKLYQYIMKNLKDVGETGKVYINFVVERDGSLTDFKIVKGLSPKADDEAIRVMKNSPQWKPGMQNGNPVRSLFTIPITFGDR